VTTFVIASSTLLQPDYVQVNALLSAHILSALTNGGNSSYLSSIPSPDQILAFQTPVSGQAVNVLWFSALGFSLASVMVAMLAKQWLSAYMSEQKCDPNESACERQRRFDGLHTWSLPHIMALLPALLHVSLFLFLIGLIIYLWQLDSKVSIATCVILGVLFIFYFASGVLAVYNTSCPYVTPISQFLRSLLSTSSITTRPERALLISKAVMWLASTKNSKSARRALRSLAGLRRRWMGHDAEQAESLAKLALEHLRGCFVPEWRHGGTYSLRTETQYDASCYSRALMNFVDDSRSPPGTFATILDDPALPIFIQLLGTCSYPSIALLSLCDYQRLLHRKEWERSLAIRGRDGSHDAQQAGKFIRREPATQNMRRILEIFGNFFKGNIFLQSFAIEIAIETIGFAPLPWVVAVSTGEPPLDQMLAPLLRFQHETRDGNPGIRRAMACTLFVFAKVHGTARLPNPDDDFAMRFETALSTIATIQERDQTEDASREMLLHGLSYLSANYEQEGGELTFQSIFDELCHEADRRSGTEALSFSDRMTVETLLPLLLVPSLDHDQKARILTRIQANAVSAAPGFNVAEDSVLFRITPRNPFPPETVHILVTTLESYKTLSISWLRDVSILLYLVTRDSTHSPRLFARALAIIELINASASEDVANHLFWIVTDALQQSISTSASDTMITFATAGVLSMLDGYNNKYGLTPADVQAWVAILPILPAIPQETQNRQELVQSIQTGIKNRDSSQLQKLQDLRKPLLQFSAQPSMEYSLESALGALQILKDTYTSTIAGDSQELPTAPHTVVLMDS
jgi:hypothetical protein